jgi:hypothetical protein
MPGESFVITYEPTADDWRAYYRYIRRDVVAGNAWDRVGALRFYLWTAAVFGGVIGLFVSGVGFDPPRIAIMLVLTTALGWLLGRTALPGGAVEEDAFVKSALDQRAGRGAARITMNDQGVEAANDVARSEFGWPMIHRIDRTADHLYLMFAAHEALFIPLRAFPNSADADAFCEAAARFHAAAHPPRRSLGFPVLPAQIAAGDENTPPPGGVP